MTNSPETPKKKKRNKNRIIAGLAAAGALAVGLSQVGEHKDSHGPEKPKASEKADAGVKDLRTAFGEAATTAAETSKPNGSLLDGGQVDDEIIRSLLNDVLRYISEALPWNFDYERDTERILNDESVNTKHALNEYFFKTNSLWHAKSGNDDGKYLAIYHRNRAAYIVRANPGNGTVNVFFNKMEMVRDNEIEVSGVEPYLVPSLLKEVDDLWTNYDFYGDRDFDPSRNEDDNRQHYQETVRKHDVSLLEIVSKYSKMKK
ncbi:hypothetical protein HYW83_00525 [Candidatus Peregrinibacteria bacterium]|nr:hypothetical protein [Candidatus Peregrinibacteria bacterium]